MRLAIISDIHGNLEAFQAVLKDIQQQDINKIVSLGDMIDYGPDSELIIREHRRLEIAGIQGNHENALINKSTLNSFSQNAFESMQITRKNLSKESSEFILALPLCLVFDNIRFVHALPPDSHSRYIDYQPIDFLHLVLQSYPEQYCFVGHTHQLGIYEFNGKTVNIYKLNKGSSILNESNKYIVNVGSVGQPRDRDKRAKYVIYDTVQKSVTARFIDYDAQATIRKIHELGYPEKNAKRLI